MTFEQMQAFVSTLDTEELREMAGLCCDEFNVRTQGAAMAIDIWETK